MFDAQAFYDNALKMVKEYLEKRGIVAIEFSTNADKVIEKMTLLNKALRVGQMSGVSIYTYWEYAYCPVCAARHPEQPFHVSLLIAD